MPCWTGSSQRAGNRRELILAGTAYSAFAGLLWFALTRRDIEYSDAASTLAIIGLLIGWFGGALDAGAVVTTYSRELDGGTTRSPGRRRRPPGQQPETSAHGLTSPAGHYLAAPAPPAPGPPIEANTAGSKDLLALPGATPALVDRCVAERERRGSFRDMAELTRALGLRPHEVVRLRPRISFEDPGPGRPRSGRDGFSMSDRLRVLRFLPGTTAEGPGRRAALWVAGCTLRCPGCFNPHSWPATAGYQTTWPQLHEQIRRARGVEGLTLLGGEPFDQAGRLAHLAAAVAADGLSVMTFTGHVLEDLLAADRSEWNALLAVTDLLVDGPYRQDLPERHRPWVGSANQRFHFLTDRYAGLAAELETLPNRLEVRIGPDGSVAVDGFAEVEDLIALLPGDIRPAHPIAVPRSRR